MSEHFKVACILVCCCFLKDVMECLGNKKLVKSNDAMLFYVSNITDKIIAEYFCKNGFTCFYFMKHMFEMFYFVLFLVLIIIEAFFKIVLRWFVKIVLELDTVVSATEGLYFNYYNIFHFL